MSVVSNENKEMLWDLIIDICGDNSFKINGEELKNFLDGRCGYYHGQRFEFPDFNLNDIDLFRWSGDDTSSAVVDIEKQQLKEGVGHLTTIATIYEMNRIFLKGIDQDINDEYCDKIDLMSI